MDLQLAEKVFIVTGGTSGLGLATARSLIAEGAKVLVTGRSEEKFLRAKAGMTTGSNFAYLRGDNADPDLPGRLKAAVLAMWGRLDGLMVSVGGPPAGHVLTTDDEAWRHSFERIFLGTIRLVRDLSPTIADGGAIALVLAVSAKEAAATVPISSGLRPGLAMLVKNFADELGPRGIRINAILPNLFSTDRVTQLLGDTAPPTATISLKRIGDPAEFGRMATVLLSSAASYVTGSALQIDGGQLKVL